MKHTFILRLLILASLFSTCPKLFSQTNKADSVKVHNLDEVEVYSETSIQKEGYTQLFLTKENRNYGTNALDAVSSMNRFSTSLNATTLSTYDNSEVFILINGVPATAMELRSYKGADIKSVKFYPTAPPQYMGFTSGPIADVIMKKRHDRLFSGYLNAINSLNTGFGTNQASFTYRDSLNLAKADYYIDYRNIHDIDLSSRYVYSSDTYTQYTEKQKYTGALHRVNGTYQLYKDNHLLSTKVSYSTNPRTDPSSGEGLYVSDGEASKSNSNSLLKSNSHITSLDLYYNYITKNSNLFAVNLVHTFGKSRSKSALWNTPVSTTQSDNSSSVSTLTKNDTYSLIVNSIYGRYIGYQWTTLSAKYHYQQLRQHYATDVYKPLSHDAMINIGTQWTTKGRTLVPSIGIHLLNQRDPLKSSTDLLPYLKIYADWWSQKIKGMTLQLTININNNAPSLGMLTDSRSYIDYNFQSKGNPYLKKYTRYFGRLVYGYFAPNGRNRIILSFQTDYSHRPIATVISYDGNSSVIQPINISFSCNNRLDLNGSWYPVRWLEISPYVELYGFNHTTPSKKIRDTYLRYGGTISVSHSNATFLLAANSPTKDYDGDLLERGSAQFAACIQYKYRNWSIGAEWHFSGKDNYTESLSPLFSYRISTDWKPLHNNIKLTATYSFSIGRSRRHSNKYLNNSSEETGLTKYNTPKGQ